MGYDYVDFTLAPKIKVKLDECAEPPTRAHATDAGLDLYNPHFPVGSCVTLEAGGEAIFDTGVHIAIPEGFVGFIKSKSGLNVKHGITADGVVDAGYTGSIVVKLYKHTGEPYTICPGDKIAQLVILPIALPTMELVTDLENTERGDNGFGSSGR